MPLNPNDPLANGQYRILRLLGRGGFGFVYQAQDTLLRDEVAIKELIPALVGDEATLKRLLAEAGGARPRGWGRLPENGSMGQQGIRMRSRSGHRRLHVLLMSRRPPELLLFCTCRMGLPHVPKRRRI